MKKGIRRLLYSTAAFAIVWPQLSIGKMAEASQNTTTLHTIQNQLLKDQTIKSVTKVPNGPGQEALQKSMSLLKNNNVEPQVRSASIQTLHTAEMAKENYKKPQIHAQSLQNVDLSQVNQRQIIVKLKDNTSLSFNELGVKAVETSTVLAKHHYQMVQVPAGVDYNSALMNIKKQLNVVFAEPDYKTQSTFVPSDADASKQWYLNAINMNEAWDVPGDSSAITVAVLDTGINRNHEDLSGRVLPGYDFVNQDSDPSDDNGHGTHVSGIIAANINNLGIAGIDFHANILPVKVMNQNGSGSVSDSIEGIYYAIDHGADVINMSYGSPQSDEAEKQAIWDAYNAGVVLVAAAGNSGSDDPMYPASYAPVISVAATDKTGMDADFSNWGNWLDVAAPGTDIYSTSYLGGYESGDGTSFSAPIVTGLVALLKAEHPYWTTDQLEWALEQSTNASSWSEFLGYGQVDAYKALTVGAPSLVNDVADDPSQAVVLQNNQSYSEKVDLPTDIDCYQFDVNESSDVTIHISGVASPLDLVGNLTKSVNGSLVVNQYIDDNGMGGDETYTFQAEPGTYNLSVFDYYNHWSSTPYNVEITETPSSVTDTNSDLVMEQEPNDFTFNANPISFDSIGSGYFQTYQDYDTFKMDLPYDGDIAILTANSENAVLDRPVALLQDESETFIDATDFETSVDNGMQYFYQTFHVSKGTHYITIANLDDNSDTVNPYVFSVSYIGNLQGEIPVPQASVESGTYYETFNVELTSPENDPMIYTLDGTTPSETNGQTYSGPIEIKDDTTLKAVAVKDGVLSNVVTYDYNMEQITVAPPVANIDSGTYIAPIKLRLNDSQDGAKVLYTLDGSTPTIDNGTLFNGPITIDKNAVVKAIAVYGRTVSDVATFNYVIDPNAQHTTVFPDTDGHWAENDIKYIANIGLIGGYPDGTFGPNKNISRAEASSIIVREFAFPGEAADFPDVSKTNWANFPIGAVTNAGIFGGYPDGDFKPGRSLTRGETAAILVRAFGLQGDSSTQFTDVQGHWAAGDISKLVANGVTVGYPDGTFRPDKNVSRAEFVSMLMRILEVK